MASSLNIARVHLQVAKKTKSNGQTAIADKNLVEAVRAQNKLRGTIKRLKARCLFLATETIVLNAEKIKPEKQQNVSVEELQASLFVRNQHKTQKSSNYQNALQNLDGIEISTRVQVQLSQQSFLKLAPNQNQNFSAEVLPYQTSQETCYQPSIHLKEPDHQDSEHPLPSSCSYQDFSNNKKSAIALKRRHEILSRMKQQKSTNLPAFVKKPVVLPDKLRTAPKTSYSCSPLKPKVDSTYNGDLGRWKKKRQEFLEIQKSLEPTKLKKLYVVLEDALTTPAIHYQAVTSLAFVQNSSSWAIDIKCLRSCGFKRSFNKVKEMRKEMHKHFEVHKRDSRWNGFCSKCAKQVVERSVKRTLSMRDELEHVLDYHTK